MKLGKLKHEAVFPCPWCKKDINYEHREETIEKAEPAVKEGHDYAEKHTQTKLPKGKD
ncbi:MAG: hypothetical protein KAJ10_05305 [Thermodesulfovibrionia bacterium]|nr:hypothetical protein [Thermodesulfovibrionia bacterium]